MSEVFAKSSGVRLRDHVQDILRVLEEFQQTLQKLQESAPLVRFWRDKGADLVRYAAVCHDLGKAQPAFQRKKLGNKDYVPSDTSFEIPHSLASLFFLNLRALEQEIGEEKLPVFLAAVAFHHFRENFLEYLAAGNVNLRLFCQKLLEDEEWRNKILANLRDELPEYQEYIGFNQSLVEGLYNGLHFLDFVPLPYLLAGFPERVRAALHRGMERERDYIFLSGILERCDHFASFCEDEGRFFPIEEENLERERLWVRVLEVIREKAGDAKIWQSEFLRGDIGANLVLLAPTGYGKTEFAFLWSGGTKLFYTLPLRVAVNSIFERAERFWGRGKVALLHSDADLFFLGRERTDGGVPEESGYVRHLSRQLSLPVVVATGDQFFPYALRPPGYERIYTTFSYSCLVIDEVQAYDPKAAAIVVKFAEDMVAMGGRFLIMTATLPEFVRREIGNRTGLQDGAIINLYDHEKERLAALCKHRIATLENLDRVSLAGRILEEARCDGGQRVLVVLNTVAGAQELYCTLRNLEGDLSERIWLLHSRFTFADRKEKERRLMEEFKNPKEEPDGPKILVATQVVEASLDIDADVLFTELAPMDALVQRMGRVLRRIGPQCKVDVAPGGRQYRLPQERPNVYIFQLQEEERSPYDPGLIRITAWILRKCVQDGISLDELDLSECPVVEKKQRRDKDIVLGEGKRDFSEYDKYSLVLRFYEAVERKYEKYLDEFRKVLRVLDTGYTSSTRVEAQRIFRDIADVSVLPKDSLEAFKEEVLRFLENSCGCRPTFLAFREAVLSKYLVSVHPGFTKLEPFSPAVHFPNVAAQVLEILENWLEHIFVAEGHYDPELGFKKKQEKEEHGNIV